MSILARLSSQVGDRSEDSNREVVRQCLDDPTQLVEIAGGLKDKNAALVGDCAEVLTQVAAQHPDWIVPYAEALPLLLHHKTTRIRWEAAHALAFIAASSPQTIDALLPTLAEIMRSDASIIVRDYTIDAIGNYAGSGEMAAERAYPLLVEGLTVWGGKHAGHALQGLSYVVSEIPALGDKIRATAEAYLQSDRGVVRKAAKELLKRIEP